MFLDILTKTLFQLSFYKTHLKNIGILTKTLFYAVEQGFTLCITVWLFDPLFNLYIGCTIISILCCYFISSKNARQKCFTEGALGGNVRWGVPMLQLVNCSQHKRWPACSMSATFQPNFNTMTTKRWRRTQGEWKRNMENCEREQWGARNNDGEGYGAVDRTFVLVVLGVHVHHCTGMCILTPK